MPAVDLYEVLDGKGGILKKDCPEGWSIPPWQTLQTWEQLLHEMSTRFDSPTSTRSFISSGSTRTCESLVASIILPSLIGSSPSRLRTPCCSVPSGAGAFANPVHSRTRPPPMYAGNCRQSGMDSAEAALGPTGGAWFPATWENR